MPTPALNTQITHTRLPASFPTTLGTDSWFTVSQNGVTLRYRPVGVAARGGTPPPLATSVGTFDDLGVVYPDIMPGIDLAYEVGNMAVHQHYVLANRPQLGANDEIAFVERIATEGVAITARVNGVEVGADPMQTTGPIDIVRADNGELVMRIAKPEAWDSNPNARTAIPLSHEVVVADNGELTYTLLVPEAYLGEGRTYPVTIDPTWEIPCTGGDLNVIGEEWCNDGDPCTVDTCNDLGGGQSGCLHTVPASTDVGLPSGQLKDGDQCW